MPIINEQFTINTLGNNDIINITKHVQNCVYQHALKEALVCVSIQGSTSAVTTIEYEQGLIKTKAGLFYKDPNLSLTDLDIIKNLENDKKNSDRESSSQYMKRKGAK